MRVSYMRTTSQCRRSIPRYQLVFGCIASLLSATVQARGLYRSAPDTTSMLPRASLGNHEAARCKQRLSKVHLSHSCVFCVCAAPSARV